MDPSIRAMLDEVGQKFLLIGTKIVIGLAVFLGFFLTGTLLRWLFTAVGKALKSRANIVALLGNILYSGLLIFGFVFALGAAGVNITALVAGLGLTGFALGFALRDALSNMLSGVLLLIYRPFKPGDRIIITGFEGVVTEINLRYTSLIADDKKILIPNSNLFINPVVILDKK